MEHLVSEGLKEGHKGIESAEKAQRRTRGSLENPHHRTSASSVRLIRDCLVIYRKVARSTLFVNAPTYRDLIGHRFST